MSAAVIKRLQQALLLLMAAVMLDTCVSAVRSNPRRFAGVAGEALPVSGKLEGKLLPAPEKGDLFSGNKVTEPAQLADLLRAETDSPWISLRFLERNGRIWRAELRVHPDARRGDYGIHVMQTGEAPGPENLYQVAVFTDAAARDRAAASFSVRWLGVSPWWVGLALLPGVIAMLAASWRRSRREERRLRREGVGVIYKLARRKDSWELAAGLGTDDGVRPGERVWLLSGDRKPVASFHVDKVYPDHLTAVVGLDVPVTPHCYVTRGDAAGERPAPPPGGAAVG